MVKKIVLSIILSSFLFHLAFAADCKKFNRPFGYYCKGPRGGWYGERRQVKTEEEAKSLIKEFFSNKEVIINKLTDKKLFYEVEIYIKDEDSNNILIIDKRNGRMRTID